MTRQEKERISNRLVANFGILLAGALVLLYVNSALQSNSAATTFVYKALPFVAGISLALGLFLFFWGKKKGNAAKNYSAICLGTLVASIILYFPKLALIDGFTSRVAVLSVYALMVVYFIVIAVITAVLMSKPLTKEPIRHAKKRK